MSELQRDRVDMTYADLNKMSGHFDVAEKALSVMRERQIRLYGTNPF